MMMDRWQYENYMESIEQKMKKQTINQKMKLDYIKIVRCKDCDVPHNKYTGCPKLNGLVTSPDFYCAFGRPKITEDIL